MKRFEGSFLREQRNCILENQKFKNQKREHSYCCQCHRLSKRLFQVAFKRINRTCVSRSEMMFMQLTLTLWRGCHQPERVRCLNEPNNGFIRKILGIWHCGWWGGWESKLSTILLLENDMRWEVKFSLLNLQPVFCAEYESCVTNSDVQGIAFYSFYVN